MTPDFTLTGPILFIGDTENKSKSDKEFLVREFVVEKFIEGRRGDDIREPIKFQASGNRCDTLDHFQVGDEVTVCADVVGRLHNDKYFINLTAWKITHAGSTGEAPVEQRRTGAPDRNFSPRPEPVSRERSATLPRTDAERLRNPQPAQSTASDEDDIPF